MLTTFLQPVLRSCRDTRRWRQRLVSWCDAVASNRLLPLSLVVLISSLLQMRAMQDDSWWQFLLLLLRYGAELSPVLLCKFISLRSHGSKALAWWCTGFILVPLGYLLARNNIALIRELLLCNRLTLELLLAIELAGLFNTLLRNKVITPLRFKPSLDNMLLLLMTIASLFWALLLNSYPDPVNHQPIPVLIDIKYNLLHPVGLISYLLQMLVLYGCMYFLYFVNHHLLVKHILRRHGVFSYLCCTALFLLLSYPLLTQIALWLPMNDSLTPFTPSNDRNPFNFWSIYIAVLVIVISLPLILAFQLQKDHRRLAELQRQSLQTELKWLQQQINPHFLFNTLNNLYSLTLSKSQQAPEVILQLADLLRFVVYKGGEAHVSLQEEIHYLNDYLALQKIRVANKCHFDIQLSEQAAPWRICPLLLVVFLENAFKHGIEPSVESSWLRVKLHIEHNSLTFSCENSLPPQRQTKPHGIGLENVKRRLALLYPGQHQLAISHNDDRYSITLSLTLSGADTHKEGLS